MDEYLMAWLEELEQSIKDTPPKSRESLGNLRRRLASKHRLSEMIGDAHLHTILSDEIRDMIGPLLYRKPTRTVSGVAPVAIMTSPSPCPHGVCTYCPGGPSTGTAQSYTGSEPAARRASRHGFDPAAQVSDRLAQYSATGHDTSKLDMIIMGGTFTAREKVWRDNFIKEAIDACNLKDSPNIECAQQNNESAAHRVIGLTVETRPDECTPEMVAEMLEVGVTRVELGIQSLDDSILKKVHRGHTVAQSRQSVALLRDAGLKVCLHMMPGLPSSTIETDIDMLRSVLHAEEWRPDMLKVYPCLVVDGTQLANEWREGEFSPIDVKAAASMLADMLAITPPWTRVQRIQRDIPANLILDGVKAGNLRQLAMKELEESGRRPGCLRERESGRVGHDIPKEKYQMVHRVYSSSGGDECFITIEAPHPDALESVDGFNRGVPLDSSPDSPHVWLPSDPPGGVVAGWMRLRRPANNHGEPGASQSRVSIVRELKVVGKAVSVGVEATGDERQHRGMGGELLLAAEAFSSMQWGVETLLVTSGMGVRPWYARRGYFRDGPYMRKDFG